MGKSLEILLASIEAQQKKLAQLKEKKQRIEAKQRAVESSRLRKDDTRRKILLGSYVLAVFDTKGDVVPETIRRLRVLDNGLSLDGFLTRDEDRVLFGLAVKKQ